MSSSGQTDELITVIQICRHGNRFPARMYKNVVRKYEVSPDEVGNLTKLGKQEMYNLGRIIRKKYESILGPKYSPNYFKAFATNSERTLMSAQLFAAGLYPPTPDEIWNDNINWHPIPIYEAGLVMMPTWPKLHCNAKYREEIKKAEEEYFETHAKQTGLADFISKNVGEPFVDILSVGAIWDICVNSKYADVQLHEWVHKVYPEPVTKFYENWLRLWFNPYGSFRNKIFAGPLLNEIVKHMEVKISNRSAGPNLLVFLGHDSSQVAVLESLRINDYTWPDYTGYLCIELWKKQGEHFVHFYYTPQGSQDAKPIASSAFEGEHFCKFEDFKDVLKDVVISKEEVLKNTIDL